MIQLLLHSLSGALVNLDPVLELVLLIAQRCELLLELGTITKQVHELFPVLARLRFALENCRDIGHGRSLYIIQGHRIAVRWSIGRNDLNWAVGKR